MNGLYYQADSAYSHLSVRAVPLLHPGPLGCGQTGQAAGVGGADHAGHVVSQQRPGPHPLHHLLPLPGLLLGALGRLALGHVGLGLADHVDVQHLATQALAVLPEASGPRVKRGSELYKRIALATLTTVKGSLH